jgi:AraC-like DNA-binding protein
VRASHILQFDAGVDRWYDEFHSEEDRRRSRHAKFWPAHAMLPSSAEKLPVPAAYSLLILREFGGTPELEAALLEETGTSAQQLAAPNAEMTLGQQLRMLHRANGVLPPGWTLRLAGQLHASAHGPIGLASVSAATLADALAINVRFATVRAPTVRWRWERGARHETLILEDRFALEETTRVVMHEAVILTVQGLIESVLGRAMKEGRIEFGFAAPSYATLYGEYFHAPCHFDCGATAMVIPSEWLGLPSPQADPALHATSVRKLEALERRLQGDDTIVLRVEELLAASGLVPSLDDVAGRLAMSNRTLVRRLASAGTTFSDLVDGQRRAQAEALLRDPNLDVAEIGYELGYEDPASFGRACRRWFGMAPGQLRENLLRQR